VGPSDPVARPAAPGQDPGVCAGLARRFGISATMMRILFVVTLIVIPGSQIIVYPILWILMPSE
jgi:phage shock protein C